VLEIYLIRWRCEESFHFIKQEYNLEDIRLLTYEGLKNYSSISACCVLFFECRTREEFKIKHFIEENI